MARAHDLKNERALISTYTTTGNSLGTYSAENETSVPYSTIQITVELG